VTRTLDVRAERWPIQGRFAISRGSVTAVDSVVVEVGDGQHAGRAECRPYSRYGETVDGVIATINGLRTAIEDGLSRPDLQSALPAGAARNALDCALWDLEAKSAGTAAWALAGLPEPGPVATAYTLSLDTPEAMRAAAERHAAKPLLKLKLAGEGDLERVRAVRAGAPDSTLIVDANEAWSIADYRSLVPEFVELGVAMIEQPFPEGQDDVLGVLMRPIPICADESCHDRASLPGLAGKYDTVNLKLDKTGGLTEALVLKADAEVAGFNIMVGCMVATSLAMAPAVLLAQGVAVVDLDGPLLLAEDRVPGLSIVDVLIEPPTAELWG
jgi:L-alanine-DL-glutamate epimerase-like enolase superfamily enzyme